VSVRVGLLDSALIRRQVWSLPDEYRVVQLRALRARVAKGLQDRGLRVQVCVGVCRCVSGGL
jgi:hypothetical protein